MLTKRLPVAAILTPNETERKRRPDDGDSGSGRRPPVDRKPTGGGGDGDNWDNRPAGSRGPRETLTRYRMGIFFALAGDLMFFAVIVCAFFVRQTSGHFDAHNDYIVDWLPIAIPHILWYNSAALLLSSITMEIARRHMFREIDVMEEWLGLGKPSSTRAMPWLVATLFFGLAFVSGQLVAWQQLSRAHHSFSSNPSSKFFYLITGIHGAHLVFGILALAAALIGLYAIKKLQARQIAVDCTAWYWHSMGVFWAFLFGLLVFAQ